MKLSARIRKRKHKSINLR